MNPDESLRATVARLLGTAAPGAAPPATVEASSRVAEPDASRALGDDTERGEEAGAGSSRRRVLAATVTTALGASGCLSRGGGSPPASTTAARKGSATATPVRRTAEGVTASFRVVDGHRPTEASATAAFEGDRVVVRGTMDPAGCRRPVLEAVGYDASTRAVRLVVGTASRYGPTATVECGNASFDYRVDVDVDAGATDDPPRLVTVTHAHHDREDRTFRLERE